MTDPSPSRPNVEQKRRRGPRLSATWLIPIAALIVSLAVAWNSYRSRGPLIEIEFDFAEGIAAEETQLRFKNYPVGVVESVDFTDDLGKVVVGVRVDRDVAGYIDEDAKFWLVSAQVGPRGITGLDTVLSGAFIEGAWDANQGERRSAFTALANPPLTPMDAPGMHIRLRAPNGGSMAVGSPLLFKQIPVGTIEAIELTDAGDVMVSAFIEAPHDERLTTLTRFWNASGFSIDIGAAGASLRVDSLAALVQGGISFDNLQSGGDPIEQNQVYQLYATEGAARSNFANRDENAPPPLELTAVFEGSVSGLEAGAEVQFRGFPVGEVTGLSPSVVQTANGPSVELRTTFTVRPNRMGVTAEGEAARDEALDVLQASVADGLRARLATAGLISPTLFIELVDVPDAEPASIDEDADPYPVIPTVPTDEADLLGSAQGVMDRVASLPVEEVMESVITLLANVNSLITDEEFQAMPGNVGGMIADLREGGAVENVNAAIESFRTIADQIAATELAARLDALVAEADTVMANVAIASDELPALTESIRELSDKANTVPIEELVASTTEIVETANNLLASSGMEDLPPRLAGALQEVERVLAELREGGTVENVNSTLASASEAADAIALAAADLPALADKLNAIADEADRVLSSFGPTSAINRDTLALLTEMRAAAQSVNSLATALERRPNSVLFGR